MHGQSKFHSLLEACWNTAAGLLFSFVIQLLLVEAYDINMTKTESAHFVFWFTIASVLRSYVIRRISNWWGRRKYSKQICDFAEEHY